LRADQVFASRASVSGEVGFERRRVVAIPLFFGVDLVARGFAGAEFELVDLLARGFVGAEFDLVDLVARGFAGAEDVGIARDSESSSAEAVSHEGPVIDASKAFPSRHIAQRIVASRRVNAKIATFLFRRSANRCTHSPSGVFAFVRQTPHAACTSKLRMTDDPALVTEVFRSLNPVVASPGVSPR
jgi:hypothetical protein